MDAKTAIEKYQCPGCVCGSDTDTCKKYEQSQVHIGCEKHVPGVSMVGGPRLCLGLPKGFNRFLRGCLPDGTTSPVRIFDECRFDYLNIPVWAKQDNENVITRTALPRLNVMYIDIYINADVKIIAPEALDPNPCDFD